MARQLSPPKNLQTGDTDTQDFKLEDLDVNFMSSIDDSAATRTVASRQRLHDKLMHDINEFLAKGGKIHQVETNVSADPPKKPESHYGQRPI